MFLATWGCAIDFLKMLTLPLPKFKMAIRGQQPKKKLRNYLNFTITFPTLWECAGDFFQGFTEIQNGHHGSTSYFFVAQIGLLKN